MVSLPMLLPVCIISTSPSASSFYHFYIFCQAPVDAYIIILVLVLLESIRWMHLVFNDGEQRLALIKTPQCMYEASRVFWIWESYMNLIACMYFILRNTAKILQKENRKPQIPAWNRNPIPRDFSCMMQNFLLFHSNLQGLNNIEKFLKQETSI